MEKTVWIVGSANFDTTYRVRKLPGRGETLLSLGLASAPGGKGLNQALAAAWAGAKTAFVGAWGDDAGGRAMREALSGFGVDCSRVAVAAEAASGHALIYVDDNGDNMIVVHAGANDLVPPPDGSAYRPGDVVAAQLEIPLETAGLHLQSARAAGALTLLNPSPADPRAATLLPHVDILVLNETEASALGNAEVRDAASAKAVAEALLAAGRRLVVVTLGGGGVVAAEPGRTFHIAVRPAEVVDTQGAGDIFLGVFAAVMAAEGDAEKAVTRANRAAGISVEYPGSTFASLTAMGAAQ